MYGKLGLPALGAAGCSYASALVSLVMFPGLLIFTATFKPYHRFSIFTDLHQPNWSHLKEMLSLGIPIGFSSTMEVTMFTVVSLLMSSFSAIAVAGHQIAIIFFAMTFMVHLVYQQLLLCG